MGKAKYKDINGFLHLDGTPISRVQIAPYRGNQIDPRGRLGLNPPLKPTEIYGVLRPADELFDEETMRSFEGMPFRVGHQMLGDSSLPGNSSLKEADREKIDGSFSNIRRDPDRPDYLLADIVVYTDRAQRAMANGTKELSLGYRCVYEPVDTYPEPKYHRGQPYFFTQRGIVANHLALVPHGRAGSSVCVQDQADATAEELVITCDSLPEEIQVMNDTEKKAKDKLVALLNGTEDEIQTCLDYCDLSEKQKAKIKEFRDGTAEVELEDKENVEDACPHCGKSLKKTAKDQMPPTPPPKKEGVTPVEEVNPDKPKTEKPAPAEGAAPATAEGETPAPATATAPATAPAEGETPAQDCNGGKKAKTFTQDEMDEACRKAKAEGRKDGIRAKLLADAVGEEVVEDKSEADVARAACKKIKGLEFAADASDEVALAAIRGHLANKEAKKPAKTGDDLKNKTLLSVTTQDEAIAKTHGSFSAGGFQKFLAEN